MARSISITIRGSFLVFWTEMRIVVVFDIYGNLFVLDVVLVDIVCRGCDLIVNLGDIVFGLFWLWEILEWLILLGLLIIVGNYEC